MNRFIFHIISESDWEQTQATGVYSPESIRTEGFIHFSTKDQILSTASLFYSGRTDLLLLAVDAEEYFDARVLKYENTMGGMELFPHLYAELKTNQVYKTFPFKLNSSGNFALPTDLPVH